MLPGILGSPEHERLANERLQSAAKVEIIKFEKADENRTVNLAIKVSNIGAGHRNFQIYYSEKV